MFRKRITIIFILSLFILGSFSQDSIYISNKDLRTTCLIFIEHEKFSIENPLLKQQVKSLEELNQLFIKTDSIQKEEINVYKEQIVSNDKKIQQLKSTQKNIIKISSVGGIVLFILGLIL